MPRAITLSKIDEPENPDHMRSQEIVDGRTDEQTDRQADNIMTTIPFGKICRKVKTDMKTDH
jgi:hypothetical protein